MKNLIFSLALLLYADGAWAQTYLNSTKDLEKHANLVMGFMANQEFSEAFIELRKYWPLPENELVQLESQTIKQFNIVSEPFGSVIEYDFVKEKTIQDYAVQKIYTLRFEKHMLQFLFTYYRNEKG